LSSLNACANLAELVASLWSAPPGFRQLRIDPSGGDTRWGPLGVLMRGVAWNVLPLLAGAVLGLSSCERSSDAPSNPEAENSAAEEPKGGGSGAKVTSISGPGGITSPDLAAGTFVGAGGRFEAGVGLQTAKGTLAELELDQGGHLYMNEDTRLSLPGGDHPGAVSLDRGELVATTTPDAGDVVVRAGDDALTLESGEVQVRAEGDTHRFAVVHGHASLVSGDRTVALSAGDTIETPLPKLAQAEPPKPTRSLSPLTDTGWARTFDAAASMADSVPRGVGSLTARRAGSKNERQAMRLTDHRVTVSISGRVAHTEVEQAFFNDQASVLEGIYRFPIPEDGSISGLSLLVGNTWMDGEVVEKQRARRIFQQIVDATVPRDPALLEWERGNVFKLRIFPIPGRGERRVKLSYTQVLPVVGGKLRYRYPLGGSGATGTPIDNFAFTVRLDGSEIPSEKLDDITTPMLALERRDQGDVIELHTEREAFLPTYDLGLDVPVPEAERPVHSRTFLDKDGQAYFMVAMEPQFEMGIDERPVHYAFVLDRSHSTSPELWTTARGVVDAMTELMDEDDRFTVLACDSACEEHQDGLQTPSSEAVSRAQQFLDGQDLAGASDLAGSLQQAADVLDRSGDSAQHVVVYLGDGVPTSGEMAPDGITDLLRDPMADTRVLAVALGSRSDLTALQAVVDVTGGDLVQADARDDLRAMVRELRLRAEVPALRNASLDLPDGMVMARMNNVSAIRPGDTVVVTGKLHHRVSGDIVLRGNGPTGAVSSAFPVELSASQASTSTVDSHLPRTWAKMQIQHLTKTEGFRAKEDIIALSKDYTVLSRHTALLVLENDAMFREFNVVRSAKKTAKWRGEFEAKTNDAPIEEGRAGLEDEPDTTTALERQKNEAAPAGGSTRHSGADDGKDNAASGPARTPTAPRAAAIDSNKESSESFDKKAGDFDDFDTDPAPEAEPDPAPKPSGADRDRLDDVVTEDEEQPAEEVIGGLLDGAGRGKGGSASGSTARPPRSTPAPSTPGQNRPKEDRRSAKPRPKQEKKKMPSKGSSPPQDSWADGDGGFGEKSDPWNREQGQRRRSKRGSGWRGRRRAPHLAIREFPTTRSRDTGRVQALASAVAANPTDRATHSKLVRTALAVGHPETLAFARAWADVDPDHAGALETLADALAREGEPIALRAYESVVEVRPFSSREHESLARAFENEGDLPRSCSHRRALVSIKPTTAHQAGLIACLQRAGRSTEAADTRAGFIKSTIVTRGNIGAFTAKLDKAILAAAPKLSRRGQLRATLTWTGRDDLDVAIIDRRGRRISTLHDRGSARTLESPGREELDLSKVRGSVFVEVSRQRDDRTEGVPPPIAANLQLVTPHGRKTVTLSVPAGTTRAARVFWTR